VSTDLSPQNEQFIQHSLARGVFHDRGEALDEAVELLKRRQELLDHIDRGTQQLRDGEGVEFRGNEQLRTLFDRIQAEGMNRYAQSKNAQ